MSVTTKNDSQMDPLALLEYRVTQLEKTVGNNTLATYSTLVTLVGALGWFILTHLKMVGL